MLKPRRTLIVLALLVFATVRAEEPRWIGTWMTSVVAESATKDTTPLAGATLRQIVHVSVGGSRMRLRLSNAFGTSALALRSVHIASAETGGAIKAGTDRELRFGGQVAVTIPAGASYMSDPLDFELAPQADLAITLVATEVPTTLTLHGGARTTSFLAMGDHLADATVPADATKFTRWYFIQGLEVAAPNPRSAAIVALGDSITDGYGTTTDHNNRWPDALVRRLQHQPDTAPLAVLNAGIGGNRLLRDGLGPNVLARFDRDVIAQAGAKWLIVFVGINDIGTRLAARKKGESFASADEIIAAFEQIATRAQAHGLSVIGATITPYQGADFYWTEDGEADRQKVNQWIRTSGRFAAVIDFDAALRDPQAPTHLAATYDSGDHLHPSITGYQHLADSVDLALFKR